MGPLNAPHRHEIGRAQNEIYRLFLPSEKDGLKTLVFLVILVVFSLSFQSSQRVGLIPAASMLAALNSKKRFQVCVIIMNCQHNLKTMPFAFIRVHSLDLILQRFENISWKRKSIQVFA